MPDGRRGRDDEADPGHPQAIGEAYAAAIPGARLVTDEPGRSPVAWQGSQLSKVIAGDRPETGPRRRLVAWTLAPVWR